MFRTTTKIEKVKNAITEAQTVEELTDNLFWLDCYIVDDGQYIQDLNAGTVYTHNKGWYATIIDLLSYSDFELYEVDEDIVEELELL